MPITPVVKQLLIINIIFFIGSQYVGDFAYQLFSMHYPENNDFKFWQPLTSMFMHADVYKPDSSSSNLMHIVFNMFALYSFGSALEHFWGGRKFLFFYISCGLGATLLHTVIDYYQIHSLLNQVSSLNLSKSEITHLLNTNFYTLFDENGKMIANNTTAIFERVKCSQEQFDILVEASSSAKTSLVGASGAIYGLLVAYAFMFPTAELGIMFIPIPIKAKYFVPGLLFIDLFLGFKGQSIFGAGSTGIAHFAHIGGAVTGFIMMWFWKKNQFNHRRWN